MSRHVRATAEATVLICLVWLAVIVGGWSAVWFFVGATMWSAVWLYWKLSDDDQ